MIRIAICDDIKFYADQIKELLLMNNGILNGEQQDIHIFSDGKDLCEYAKNNQLDQIYLDIDMPVMNGMEAAAYIREILQDNEVSIIFMTGTSEHDRKLFDYQPFGFLEKPIDEEKLVNIMRKLYQLKHAKDRKLNFKSEGTLYSVFFHQIIYIQRDNHDIVVNWHNGNNQVYANMRGTIKEMEQNLPAGDFVKINSGVIVRLQCIECISKDDVVLKNGQRFSVSRRCKDSVEARWLDSKMQMK